MRDDHIEQIVAVVRGTVGIGSENRELMLREGDFKNSISRLGLSLMSKKGEIPRHYGLQKLESGQKTDV